MQEKKINRSNSFVANALKWWPINNSSHQSNSNLKQFGSTVAVQKLRESKWFTAEEQRIFCAVVECGFIVEVNKNFDLLKSTRLRYNSKEDDDENDELEYDDEYGTDSSGADQENFNRISSNQSCASTNASGDNKDSWFGIVICKNNKDNKPKPETIEVFSVKIRENGVRVFKLTLDDIWKNNWKIRINNFADREKAPHNEKDIKNQVSFARKAKCSLWHNTKHYAYWCRYGSRQQDVRKRQMSECVKWGSVGMNAGMLLVMNNKPKSLSK